MILVTGGCGYIGSHLVKMLTEKGEQVIVFDNLKAGKKNMLLHNEKLVIGDIADPLALEKLFDSYSFEAVYHLAALVNAAESGAKESEYRLVNEKGSEYLWYAAKQAGVKYCLYASSAAVYGTPQSRIPLTENSPTRPTNVYGETKLAGEKSLANTLGNNRTFGIFRFFNVAGAEKGGRLGQSQKSKAIIQRLFAVASGQTPALILSGHDYNTPDGTVIRDFVHVEDIARALVLGLERLRKGGESFTVNLGSGQTTSLLKLHALAERVTDKEIPLQYAPRIPGDIDYSLAEISRAQNLLAWQPEHNIRQVLEDGWKAYVKSK